MVLTHVACDEAVPNQDICAIGIDTRTVGGTVTSHLLVIQHPAMKDPAVAPCPDSDSGVLQDRISLYRTVGDHTAIHVDASAARFRSRLGVEITVVPDDAILDGSPSHVDAATCLARSHPAGNGQSVEHGIGVGDQEDAEQASARAARAPHDGIRSVDQPAVNATPKAADRHRIGDRNGVSELVGAVRYGDRRHARLRQRIANRGESAIPPSPNVPVGSVRRDEVLGAVCLGQHDAHGKHRA